MSVGEVLGTAIGVLGAALLAFGASGWGNGNRVTLAGDMVSLFGAAMFVGYLNTGRRLRQWMPLVSIEERISVSLLRQWVHARGLVP